MVVAWSVESAITDLGCTVVGPVARVSEALALIETAEAPDGVVLDVNLNGEYSYPVADALVARGIPFVFSTGYNRDFFPEAYRSFPMLQKPYTDSELADALIKLLPPENLERRTSASCSLVQ